jgi:hypothetical protein
MISYYLKDCPAMLTKRYLIALLALVVLTSCGQSPSAVSSRAEAAPLNFAAQPAQMDAQALALTELSRRIVVQTTIQGAGIGAAVGCGLAVVSAGNAQSCIVAAATGAAGGALIGRVTGQQEVQRRIEKISPSAVVRTVRKTNKQLALVTSSLPARLAAQEDVLTSLELHRATGAISAQDYANARASIAAERQALAAALIETEGHARQATSNLRAAQSLGQTGLEWHIGATSKLAIEASSARSSISLL